ncbi:class I SAM-dependent methyltransferase [Methylobacterium sp. ID0610]|uniref:class I SAM-dependent methyltransferase n=1 Tax=Methylobacterium carpenticola TaxID=3344827 RepID=UPI0036CA3A1D
MNALKRLVMIVRQRIPAGIRPFFKVLKLLTVKGATSPQIPAHLLTDCRLLATRQDLARALGGGRVAEIGTQHGRFARFILDEVRPERLHVVDLDVSRTDRSVLEDPRVAVHVGFSTAVLSSFEDASFDWIYIDADHSYEGVRADAEAARSKVKPGGYIVFNDFAHADPFLGVYGVHRAATEFLVRHQWPVRFMSYDPNALYDIAVQRPAR